MNRWLKWVVMVPAAFLLAGCGAGSGNTANNSASSGGGNGSSGGAVTDLQRQTAVVKTVQTAVQVVGGGGFVGGVTGKGVAGNSSALPLLSVLTRSAAVHSLRGTGSLYYLPVYNVYYSASAVSSNQINLQFYSDANGTQGAGSGSLVMTSSPGSYPVVATLTYTITAGNTPGNGSLTLTVNDVSGSTGSIRGTIYNSLNNFTYTYDPLNINGSTVTGSVTGSGSGITIALNNVNLNTSSGTMSANFNISPQGWSGSMSYNSDGSGNLSLNDPSGTTRAQWNAAGNATITFPDGSQTTIQNIFTS